MQRLQAAAGVLCFVSVLLMLIAYTGLACAADVAKPAGTRVTPGGDPAARKSLPAAAAARNPLRAYFPYGVFAGAQTSKEDMDRICKDLAAHNMNAIWLGCTKPEWIPDWLDAARKHGIRVVVEGWMPGEFSLMFVRPAWFKGKADLVQRVGGFYEPLVKKHKDDPALLAWPLSEENVWTPWFYEALAELTGKIAEWDPSHPAITLDNRSSVAWRNAQVVRPKALAMDKFCFWVEGINGPITPIGARTLWTSRCRQMRHAAESIDVPFWMMGQGHTTIDVWGQGRRQLEKYHCCPR